MQIKYGYRINPSGWDMNFPCEKISKSSYRPRRGTTHHLWFMDYFDKNEPDWFYREIGQAASHVFGLDFKTSLELLKREEPEFLELLIKIAKKSPPPEF
jgi:hypothetical protein